METETTETETKEDVNTETGEVEEKIEPKYKASVTGIMDYLISPAHYYSFRVLKEREPSDAMVEGIALHMAVLEPDKFEETVFRKAIPTPKGWQVLRTADDMKIFLKSQNEKVTGKKEDLIKRIKEIRDNIKPASPILFESEFASINSAKMILTEGTYDKIIKIRDKVHAHKFFSHYKGKGTCEQFVEGEIEGVHVRGKIDWNFFIEEMDKFLIMDLKKTTGSDLFTFQKTIWYSRLYVQAWLYCELIRQTHGKESIYGWIAAEGLLPHIVEVYACDEATLEAGEMMARKALRGIKKSIDDNRWPGYSNGDLVNINLPHWAYDVVSNECGE